MAAPDINRIRELLNYDPETGVLTWRVSRPGATAGAVAGSLNNLGYIQVMIDRKQCLGHRIAWLIHSGTYPKMNIDHINGERSDNRISNLRECNQSQNNANMRGGQNRSGYKGVQKIGNRYRAYIGARGVNKHLGYFATPEEAHAAYFTAAKELFGEFARAA